MHVDFKLGLSCNNKCRHCVMEPTRRNLLASGQGVDTAWADLEALFNKWRADGLTSLTLTGGEPTLREDFWRILDLAAATGAAVGVQTNGRRLAEAKEKLAALKGKNVFFVVALHGPEAGIHDRITQAPGSFAETVEGLGNLVSLGFPVCGKLVLSNHNLAALPATLDFMRRLGLKEALVAFPHAEDFTLPELRDVLPRYAEVKKVLLEIKRDHWPLEVLKWESIPFCVFPAPEFFPQSIDLDYMRQRLKNENTTIEMTMTGERLDWNESRRSIKSKSPRCRGCLLDLVCEGVWSEYLDLYGDDDFAPVTDQEVVSRFLERLP